MQKISLFAFVFVLIACSTPAQVIPTASVALTVPPTSIPTSIPTLTETATPIPTETPAPATIDPYLSVDLGHGMWESSADMTIDLGNGPIEFEFATEEAKQEVKRACDIAMWFSQQAGKLGGKSGAVDVTGKLVLFETFMQQVKANNGIMNEMYSLGAHPSTKEAAEVSKIPGTVDMNKCTLRLKIPGKDYDTMAFSNASRAPWYWFEYSASGEGIVIKLAPGDLRSVSGGPFVNKDSSKTENAENMSKIIAMWIESMNRLSELSSINHLLSMGNLNPGDPRRVEIGSAGVTSGDITKFFEDHPEAKTKWVKLAE